MKTPTMGGKQFWGDEFFFRGWRIQRNVFTGHYRLLDGDDLRHAWGSSEDCRAALDRIRREQTLPPMQGKAVVLLHGLCRSRSSMKKMARYLEDEGDFVVFNVTYPSTRADVGSHAAALAKVIDSLDGIEEINFVAHSLGNLVVRHYLADQTDPASGRRPDRRIKRIVMLGPPNNGALMARTFGRNKLFELITGQSGRQLAVEWTELRKELATPACQFGILAGGRGGNPILKGRDDLIVSVEETRLVGARDFAVLPVFHLNMMNDAKVQQYTLRFLQEGHFISEDRRQPIVEEIPESR